MFFVSYGSERREKRIMELAHEDLSLGVILAAVHFEWMMKRTILKLGKSPTKQLREELANVSGVFRAKRKNGYEPDGYNEVWDREVKSHLKGQAALGSVLGKLTDVRDKASKVRGHLIHGNGTVSRTAAEEAIKLYLGSAAKLRSFATKNGVDVDSRLKARPATKAKKQ